MDWPEWWDWELDLTPHLLKRMVDRSFSETDLRSMLASAIGFRASAHTGRFVIDCTRDGKPWELIVEPDEFDSCLIVVTGYPVA